MGERSPFHGIGELIAGLLAVGFIFAAVCLLFSKP